jgi:hypothetical protein
MEDSPCDGASCPPDPILASPPDFDPAPLFELAHPQEHVGVLSTAAPKAKDIFYFGTGDRHAW